jgi:NAD-dependent deacetylase
MNFDPEMIERLRKAQHIAVFTGAGVSQESGIPTFRDALTGLWEKYDAELLATPQAFAKEPDLVWGWYEWRRALALRCQPNPAHDAIVSIAAKVSKLTVITQNVDDLHERAGSTNVIHLHGSLHAPRCKACGRSHALSPDIPDEPDGGRRQMPPKCTHCGGRIRPGVVWFGEELPSESWRQSKTAINSCNVLFSIGTSSLIYPAAELPRLAAARRACVIQVNPHVTEMDRVARFNLKGKAGEIMPALVGAVWP